MSDVIRTTDELVDQMWFWLLVCYSVFALFALVGVLLHLPPIAILALLPVFAPWVMACWRVHQHTALLNEETRKRGKGWAA